MDIKWSSKSIDDLNYIVNYLKKNRLGEMLEVLADYYISEYSNKFELNKYSMDFSETIDPSKITEGEFKLAFICELVNIKIFDKSKRKKKLKFQNVYYFFSLMIRNCIKDLLKLDTNKSDYKGYHLISILKEKIIIEIEKKDHLLDILNISYHLVSQLINITEKYPDIIYTNSSLMTQTQNIDINILSKKEIREIFNILGTKRTLFIRILLLLSYNIIKFKDILKSSWIAKTMIFTNHENFLLLVTNPLIEVIIFLSAFSAKNGDI